MSRWSLHNLHQGSPTESAVGGEGSATRAGAGAGAGARAGAGRRMNSTSSNSSNSSNSDNSDNIGSSVTRGNEIRRQLGKWRNSCSMAMDDDNKTQQNNSTQERGASTGECERDKPARQGAWSTLSADSRDTLKSTDALAPEPCCARHQNKGMRAAAHPNHHH